MIRPVQIVALLLAYLLMPGAVEATESAVHLAVHGDSAHDETAGHKAPGSTDEHGCSGAFHLCSCHHTPTVVQTTLSHRLAENTANQTHTCPPIADAVDSGVHTEPFRPPIL